MVDEGKNAERRMKWLVDTHLKPRYAAVRVRRRGVASLASTRSGCLMPTTRWRAPLPAVVPWRTVRGVDPDSRPREPTLTSLLVHAALGAGAIAICFYANAHLYRRDWAGSRATWLEALYYGIAVVSVCIGWYFNHEYVVVVPRARRAGSTSRNSSSTRPRAARSRRTSSSRTRSSSRSGPSSTGPGAGCAGRGSTSSRVSSRASASRWDSTWPCRSGSSAGTSGTDERHAGVGRDRDRRGPQRPRRSHRARRRGAARAGAGEERLRRRHVGHARDPEGLPQRGRRERALPARRRGAGGARLRRDTAPSSSTCPSWRSTCRAPAASPCSSIRSRSGSWRTCSSITARARWWDSSG